MVPRAHPAPALSVEGAELSYEDAGEAFALARRDAEGAVDASSDAARDDEGVTDCHRELVADGEGVGVAGNPTCSWEVVEVLHLVSSVAVTLLPTIPESTGTSAQRGDAAD